MTHRRPTTERLGAFSDGVFAVIITIMVLELKPPSQPSFAALLALWPTALSYAVSYLFIAIVWVNHHHLLRFAEHATPRLVWINFAHLFMVSLVPFSTAWVAGTRLAAVPVFVSLKFPLWCFGLICCVLLLYLRPEPPEIGREVARKVALSDAASPQQEDIR